jgi:putative methyltransferase (TIGR04325 family)
MIKYSPVVLFLYNRPNHTKLTLDALAKNVEAIESELFIYCDGLKLGSSEKDKHNVQAVRQIANEENRFKKVNVIYSEQNLGLANSIISGVTYIVNRFGRIIVLEDDIVPSVGFLKFMNEALDLYENEDKVGCIHAWNYDLDSSKFRDTTFFLRGADCWGWATWKSSWSLFNPNGNQLLHEIKNNKLEYSFNRNGTHPFVEMLGDQIKGKNDSWAIRWHASLFLNDKFCLHPVKPIVRNIGLDNSGTHCGDTDLVQDTVDYIKLKKINVDENPLFFEIFLRNQKNKSFNRVKKNKIKKIIEWVTPPIFLFFLKKIYFKIFNKVIPPQIWTGNYANWEEAKKKCIGYDSQIILEKCKNSLLQVKNGTAIYERDSVIFDKIQYSWGLLAGLQKAAINNGGKLCVLDFGGSLGSSFFQNKDFLAISDLKWCIVEQPNFIECGKEFFESDQLKFYYTIDECLQNAQPNVLLLSSVLQYLEEPHEWIEKFSKLNFKYIVIDRTPFINNHNDILTIQNVPGDIYKASYPSWFFDKEKVLNSFNNYFLISEFQNEFSKDYLINNISAKWVGMILEKKHTTNL